jgi:uncharacterized membrane protein YhhN
LNGALYAAATGAATAGQVLGSHALEYASRPLIMLVLSSWFYFNSRRAGDRFTLLVQAGLFFSMLADVLLMLQHIDGFLFLTGVAALLVAHLCCMIAMAMNVFDVGTIEGGWIGVLLAVLPVAAGLVCLLEVLNSPAVDQVMRLPVVLLLIAVSCMSVFAALRFHRTFPRSFWLVFIGCMVFMISDALLLNLKFNLRPFQFGRVWIMFTYAGAQFLIAAGCLLHVLDPETIRRRNELNV